MNTYSPVLMIIQLYLHTYSWAELFSYLTLAKRLQETIIKIGWAVGLLMMQNIYYLSESSGLVQTNIQ